jgi:hypothetical protein
MKNINGNNWEQDIIKKHFNTTFINNKQPLTHSEWHYMVERLLILKEICFMKIQVLC